MRKSWPSCAPRSQRQARASRETRALACRGHADISSVYDYFAEKDARVATLLVDRIKQAVVGLAKRDTGHPGRMPKRYIIAYRIRRNDLIIVRILHASQNWTATAWPKSWD